jgi:peptidoglycan hydrolase CwlO-like protein
LEKDCGIASSVSSAQHGNVPTNLEIVRDKIDKLQVELTSLSEQHGGFAANLESVKQDISNKTSQVRQEDSFWPTRL